MTRPALFLIVLLPAMACGAGEANGGPTDDQESAAPDASPDLAGDLDTPAWTVTVQGPEGALDLADIEGDELDASKLGTTLQLSGIDPEHMLTVRMTVGSELTPGEYGPSTFSITWPALDHTCVAGTEAVQVDVEEVEPVRGTFSGRVRCYASSNPTEAFEAQVSGTFRDTV